MASLLRGSSRDLRVALRQLPRDLRLWLVASLTLGLGIGANAALYLFLQPVLLSPLPYAQPERLAYLWQTDEANGEPFAGVSIPDLRDFQQRSTAFAALGAYARRPMALRHGEDGGAERATVLQASHELFPVLSLQPLLGRAFAATDDVIGAAPVALLGHATWMDRFGGSDAALGRSILVDGTRHRIVGVLPPARSTGLDAPVWIPLIPAQADFTDRGVHGIVAVGRLRTGVSIDVADAEAATIASALAQEYPEENVGRGATVVSMHGHLVRDLRQPLQLLALLTLSVLLLAGVNVGVLLFARAAGRSGELAVRAGLGATPARLLRMLALEQVLFGAAAGIAALAITALALKLFALWNPLSERFAAVAPQLDLGVATGTLAASVLLSLLFGVLPAYALARRAAGSLASAGRATDSGGTLRVRRVLVAVQAALAVLLVSSAMLFARGFAETIAVDPGFAHADTVRIGVALPPDSYPFPGMARFPAWPEVVTLQSGLLEQVGALPFVESVALAQNHPLEPGWTSRVERPDQPQEGPPVEWTLRAVSPGYLQVTGLPLLAGRPLQAQDGPGAAPVLLINQAAARSWFAGEDPLGKQIGFWGKPRTIVGVVGDERFDGAGSAVPPAMYPPLAQTPFSEFSLLVRLHPGAPAGARQQLEQAVWTVEPAAALFGQDTLAGLLDAQMAPRRFALTLVLAMAVIALLLAVSGVHGVTANDVRRRRAEFGLRRALGARGGSVVLLAARRALAAVAAGALVGVALVLVAGGALQATLQGVPATDPLAIALAFALFLGAAGATALTSARAASRIEPMLVLRQE